MRENGSRAQTFPLKHVSMPDCVVWTSTLASGRCNPLPCSALTGRLLVPFVVAFNEPKASSSFDVELMAFGVYGLHVILQKSSGRVTRV